MKRTRKYLEGLVTLHHIAKIEDVMACGRENDTLYAELWRRGYRWSPEAGEWHIGGIPRPTTEGYYGPGMPFKVRLMAPERYISETVRLVVQALYGEGCVVEDSTPTLKSKHGGEWCRVYLTVRRKP